MEAPKGFKSHNTIIAMINCLCKVQPTIDELLDSTGPRMTIVSSRLRPLKHVLDQRQPFCVLGLRHDAMTTQLIQVILMNVLGFRRGPFGSHSSSRSAA